MDELLEIPVASLNSTAPEPSPESSQTGITPPPASTQPSAPATPAVPSVEEMQQMLEKSGQLLNEIPVAEQKNPIDNSPLAALQPGNMMSTEQGPQPIPVPAVRQRQLKDFQGIVVGENSDITTSGFPYSKILQYTLALLLTIQGGWNISQSLKWTIVTYPQLEADQLLAVVTQETLNGLILRIAVSACIGLVSLFLALRLLRQKQLPIFSFALGILLVLFNLVSGKVLPTEFFLSDPVGSFTRKTQQQIDQKLDDSQFLQQNNQGNFDVVWEK